MHGPPPASLLANATHMRRDGGWHAQGAGRMYLQSRVDYNRHNTGPGALPNNKMLHRLHIWKNTSMWTPKPISVLCVYLWHY